MNHVYLNAGAPHAHILLWMVDEQEEISNTVYINGKEITFTHKKQAPNYKNSVEGKRGKEREDGIRRLEAFAELLISVSTDDSEEKVVKYQTHHHTFTCHKKNRGTGWIVVGEDEGFGKDDSKKKGQKLKTPKCRFKFPRFPIRKTTFLEPLSKIDNEEIVIKKANVNLNRIKKFMLRNLFQERKGECSTDRETFLSLTFDEFLIKLGISEKDYLNALRASVTGMGSMFMKRSCKEVFTNNFNRKIMAVHPANQDFTLCIDENQVAAYIINYLTKNEAGQSKMLKEVDEQCAKQGLSYSEKLKMFANALDQSREVSVQEIVYRLLGLPMTQFSRKIKYLSTSDCQNRDGILKQDLDNLEEGESAFLKSAVDYYEKRPDSLEMLTLADFWSRYEIVYGKKNEKNIDEVDDNFDNDDERQSRSLQRYQLKDDFGTIRERTTPAVLRYYLNKSDEYETIRGTLILFHPFRNEYEEISSQHLKIVWEKIQQNELQKKMIESQLDFYQPYQSILDGINSWIEDQKQDEEEEEDDYDDDENVVEDYDKVELETTDNKNIDDFVKQSKREKIQETDLMCKKTLLQNIGLLNRQQRKIFDDLLERLMNGDFQTNQFLLYIRYLKRAKHYFYKTFLI